jgi:hypothetical protein
MDDGEKAGSEDEVDESKESPNTLKRVSARSNTSVTQKSRKFNELNPALNSPIAAALSARTIRNRQQEQGHVNKVRLMRT